MHIYASFFPKYPGNGEKKNKWIHRDTICSNSSGTREITSFFLVRIAARLVMCSLVPGRFVTLRISSTLTKWKIQRSGTDFQKTSEKRRHFDFLIFRYLTVEFHFSDCEGELQKTKKSSLKLKNMNPWKNASESPKRSPRSPNAVSRDIHGWFRNRTFGHGFHGWNFRPRDLAEFGNT